MLLVNSQAYKLFQILNWVENLFSLVPRETFNSIYPLSQINLHKDQI